MNADSSVIVSVDITNTGTLAGDEIAQLYVRDKVSSVTRPVKELRGFERVSLQAGETKSVFFTLDKSSLAFWDVNMNFNVEPGYFDIMIGSSSEDFKSIELLVE
jgi:beta-glucosidase